MNDKDVVMNEEFFAEGTKYNYCKLDTYTKDQTFEGLCSADGIPVLGRTISKTDFFDGQVSDGKFNGFGQLYNFDDQTYYTGSFKNGLKHGIGETYAKGVISKQIWYKSIYMGESSSDLGYQMMTYEALQLLPYYEAKTADDKKLVGQI